MTARAPEKYPGSKTLTTTVQKLVPYSNNNLVKYLQQSVLRNNIELVKQKHNLREKPHLAKQEWSK